MTRREHPAARAGRKIGARQIAVLALVALTLLFILQNRDTVQIAFFTLTVTAALWLVLVIMLGLGVLIGVLAGRPSSRNRR